MEQVIVIGGTGYIGIPLIQKLIAGGFQVTAVARPQSIAKLPAGCAPIAGSPLDAHTYQDHIPPASTLVHLVGTPHPAPWKAAQFRSVDLVALQQSVAAAQHAAVKHLVFVSVAHPAPAMKAYVAVRIQCERILHESGLTATIVRPWYVLGPGHYWPYVLLPIYKILEMISATRESAIRLGLVTRAQMVNTLASAVASPTPGIRILTTADIRSLGTTP
jgi:uncharacterized protein YbjT (DUF2867 family)